MFNFADRRVLFIFGLVNQSRHFLSKSKINHSVGPTGTDCVALVIQ